MDISVGDDGCVEEATARDGSSEDDEIAQQQFLGLVKSRRTYSISYGARSRYLPALRAVVINPADIGQGYYTRNPGTGACNVVAPVRSLAQVTAHELGHAYMHNQGTSLGQGYELIAVAYENYYLGRTGQPYRCRY